MSWKRYVGDSGLSSAPTRQITLDERFRQPALQPHDLDAVPLQLVLARAARAQLLPLRNKGSNLPLECFDAHGSWCAQGHPHDDSCCDVRQAEEFAFLRKEHVKKFVG